MRAGNFNSSTIAALLSMGSRPMNDAELAAYKAQFPKSQKKNCECWPGEAAETYIEECNMERRLGQCLEGETSSKPTDWGHCCEAYVFNNPALLGLEYSTISKQTIQHPDYDFWTGTPDSICYGHENTVVDLKCPFTKKSFCQLVDGWEKNGIQGIRDNHKDGEKFYWQLVSNACLTGCNHGELIVFCPYENELGAIDKSAWPWMAWSELPYLIEGRYYTNLNKMRFPIPESDKKLLTDRVIEAGKMLVTPKLVTV